MRIIGCDLHARHQTLATLDTITGEEKRGYAPAAAFLNAYLGLDDKEQAFSCSIHSAAPPDWPGICPERTSHLNQLVEGRG